jgi:hypothetical protein
MKKLCVALICVSCFREAPPCDSATLERIKRSCRSEEECIRQLDEREAVCAARFRRGE